MRQQTLIWTSLPYGNPGGGYLELSVFLSPQLVTDEGSGNPTLSLFPDFVNWPTTIGPAGGNPITFSATFGNGKTVPATVVDVSSPWTLNPGRWAEIFDPNHTKVTNWSFTDYTSTPMQGFPAKAVHDYIQSVYKSWGQNYPSSPPVLTGDAGGNLQLPAGSKIKTTYQGIINGVGTDRGNPALAQAVKYYTRPGPAITDPLYQSELITLDFHQAISALGSYPILLREFGLVFDLLIPNQGGSGNTTIYVTPAWTENSTYPGTTQNVSPKTACTISPSAFRARPAGILGAVDYLNGMLNLADTTRFSVTDLDCDGGSLRMNGLSKNLVTLATFQGEQGAVAASQTVAVTLPALRSQGPAVVRNGFASTLGALTARQKASYQSLQTALIGGGPLPIFYAEDIMRGHRFDVFTLSDPTPGWYSLHEREGAYSFGPLAGPNAPSSALPFTAEDEGFVVPGASQDTSVTPAPPDLYVHDEIARWSGWSLSAPRPGSNVAPDDTIATDQGNPPAPMSPADPNGNYSPQMSAAFSVVPGSLPRLRFGDQYLFRARGVDLAGNGPSPTSTDGSTATSAVTHYRYEPVVAPTLAGTGPYTPGQGTLLVALLNDMVNPVQPVGRWLIPPRASELMAEEHGMWDGFVLGHPHNSADPPDGSADTWSLISTMDAATIADLPGVQTDKITQGYYFPLATVSQLTTPWIPDPLSAGAAMRGLPGDAPGLSTVRQWSGGPWPTLGPLLVQLQAIPKGQVASHSYTAATSTSSALETVDLPPAAVYNVRVSSSLTDTSTLGVFQWIVQGLSLFQATALIVEALQGQNWMTSPFVTVRMAHAVRLPVSAPQFLAPTVVPRPYGSRKAEVYDIKFLVDEPSTVSVDVEAAWTDPIDDPSDLFNDPAVSTLTTTGPAFKLSVPDPNPELAADVPGTVLPAPESFALTSSPGATHDIGDTKHHLMNYTPIGTSRFAEFFRPPRPLPTYAFPDTTPVQISSLGLNAGTVELYHTNLAVIPPVTTELDPSEFVVDPVKGTVALVAGDPNIGETLSVDFVPTVTLSGPTTSFHILASARPSPPKVDRVVPAWQLASAGSVSAGHFAYRRAGNFLRVWLDRPWYSSGANELLGVVVLSRQFVSGNPPPDPQYRLGTLVSLDPVSLPDPSLFVPTSPQNLAGMVTLPKPIPGRPAYSNPPTLHLAEDSSALYEIYPFAVNYDESSGQWYADIKVGWLAGQAPPPGYFVRLALVRFQPYAYPGAEVSPVVLATYAQPVADRAVSVVKSTPQSVRVSVSGPAYKGFRPAGAPGTNVAQVNDIDNQFAPQPYSYGGGQNATSAMTLEVQLQNTTSGLSGDLAWQTVSQPVLMNPAISGTQASWNAGISLPFPIGQGTPMRLRVSEIDYYTGAQAPPTIDTTVRRPFVAHIPIV